MKTIQFSIPQSPPSQQSSAKVKRQFQETIKQMLSEVGFIITSDVQVSIEWLLPEYQRYESDKTPDVDNILKPLLDALGGPEGIIVDDSQVQALEVKWIEWENPEERVDVSISYEEDFTLPKDAIAFVKIPNTGLSWPFNQRLPVETLLVLFDTWETMFKSKQKLLSMGIPYGIARAVLPQQRMFHVSRTKGFTKRYRRVETSFDYVKNNLPNPACSGLAAPRCARLRQPLTPLLGG